MSGRDRGAILVLTLVFTVILGVVVLAIANYATTGLKTSRVATERTDTNADGAGVMTWAVEQFGKKQLHPDIDCGAAPASLPIAIPAGLLTNGYGAALTCAQTTPIAGEPVVHLVSTVTPPAGATRTVEATVEVPRYIHGARVADWRVDIPIDVPAYVTTTTSPSATTIVVNAAPVANATTWIINPSAPTAVLLDASDADGSIVASTIDTTPLPAGLTLVSTGPTSYTIEATTVGTYNLTYTVTDDDGASAASTIVVDVTTTTTTTSTTTTTLAPNPACGFQITSVVSNQKQGQGTLSVSNLGGGAFDGWQVNVSRTDGDGDSWSFGWTGDVSVSGTYTITSGATTSSFAANEGQRAVASAAVTNGPNGAKLTVGDIFACSVTTP